MAEHEHLCRAIYKQFNGFAALFPLDGLIGSIARSMNAGLARLLSEMPPQGKRVRTDLSRIIIEERE